MSGVNKVTLLGILGDTPEFRSTPDGKYSCYLVLVTDSRVQDGTGVWVTVKDKHRVALFGDLAVLAYQNLRRGDQAYVEGSLKTRKWLDTKTNKAIYQSEVVGDKLELLDADKKARDLVSIYRQRHGQFGNGAHEDEAAIEVMLKTGAAAWRDAGSASGWIADLSV